MIHKQKPSVKALEEFLESDDEFPDTYSEKANLPAYLDDDRFKHIEFSWIHNDKYKFPDNESNVNKEKPSDVVEIESKIKPEPKKFYHKRNILEGLLNKCDIVCLKSVEKTMSNENLLWFAKFLMYKDMQSHFITPRSCLVSEPVNISIGKHDRTVNKSNDKSRKPKCTYRVIISKEFTYS